MIILRNRWFSRNKILNTNISGIGFTRGRNYDMDLGRLGRMSTAQRELSRIGDLRKESRKLNSELNLGIGRWQHID